MASRVGRIHAAEAPRSGKALEDAARVAFRWSGDEAEVGRLEESIATTISVDLLNTVAVMIVGLIGVGLSFLD